MIEKQGAGSCDQRAILLKKKLDEDGKYASRIVRSACHSFVEVQVNGTWYACEVSGYAAPAPQVINPFATESHPFDPKKEKEPSEEKEAQAEKEDKEEKETKEAKDKDHLTRPEAAVNGSYYFNDKIFPEPLDRERLLAEGYPLHHLIECANEEDISTIQFHLRRPWGDTPSRISKHPKKSRIPHAHPTPTLERENTADSVSHSMYL